ncbi:Deoxyribonuclease (DNase) II [Trichuris trichiura]|uniref:Deoxyribonuclease (DNase) II n=1 Tax=Trichuris trichiura TaxID=36087 RepID=A0A077ZQD0_TRITR|nr:Deoxyribonuclease (DNase) II [Trichuris trichiura]
MHSLWAILIAAIGVHLTTAQSNNTTTASQPITCIALGGAVDWFLVYKDPSSLLMQLIVAAATPTWQQVTVPITGTTGNPIYDTTAAFVDVPSASSSSNATNLTTTSTATLAYSDQPPGIINLQSDSNAKGLIITDVEIANGSAIAWIVHTVPTFLARAMGYKFSSSQSSKGHMALCLTVEQTYIGLLAQQLRYQAALVYYFYLPASMQERSEEVKKLVANEIVILPPFALTKSVKTTATTSQIEIRMFSKTAKSKMRKEWKFFVRYYYATILDTYKKYMRKR